MADIIADDRRASELIQQLRRFLRRGESERTQLDLGDVISEACRIAGTEANARAIAVRTELEPQLPPVAGNRVQLQQVILNLLLNAIDAVKENESRSREVKVLACRSESGVCVEVSDRGPGMDEQTLTRIFQPFFSTKPGGMGLGLSISRTIVEAHGGALLVQSVSGRGTTFRVELPLRSVSEEQPKPEIVLATAAKGTVYVIDDEPSMRRALSRQLQSTGYRVETFASAQEYLDHAREADVACIVSDVRMPGLSGLDLQAWLAEAKRELPIIFISGHGDVQTTVRAMRAGAVSFLPKPFTKEALLAAAAEALARSSQLASNREHEAQLRARYESLTPREREVFSLVAAGLLNKVIADRLGAAETTIKIHRGRVMDKMGATSIADLVRIAARLRMSPPALERDRSGPTSSHPPL